MTVSAAKAFRVPHIALVRLLRGKLKGVLADTRPDLIAPLPPSG